MSVKVSIEDFSHFLEEYGSTGFLITVGENGFSKVVHVSLIWDTQVLRCTPGKGTLANLSRSTEGGSVTLIFPNPIQGEFSMLVDGRGFVMPENETEIIIEIEKAVLHRPPLA